MPHTVDALLTARGIHLVRHPSPSFVRSFRQHGARVDIAMMPTSPYLGSAHLGTAVTGTEKALRWFDRLR